VQNSDLIFAQFESGDLVAVHLVGPVGEAQHARGRIGVGEAIIAGLTLSFPRTWRTIMGKITFAAALVACAGFEIASAEAAIVVVSKTIQAAVDEANPGDIILVPPGTYRETVRVLKDSITILGSKGAVIDAISW
jgi:hypothetical protein